MQKYDSHSFIIEGLFTDSWRCVQQIVFQITSIPSTRIQQVWSSVAGGDESNWKASQSCDRYWTAAQQFSIGDSFKNDRRQTPSFPFFFHINFYVAYWLLSEDAYSWLLCCNNPSVEDTVLSILGLILTLPNFSDRNTLFFLNFQFRYRLSYRQIWLEWDMVVSIPLL